MIQALDLNEELAPLSLLEQKFRLTISDLLQRTIRQKVAFWKQRGKIRGAIEGDENTRFFHASATQRSRTNKIPKLIHSDADMFLHEQKAAILKNFFLQLIGVTKIAIWNFDLLQLYPLPLPQLRELAIPFAHKEIQDAFLNMNTNASPGPDGFDPIFFCKYWQEVKHSIFLFFSAFHEQTTSLERFNRAFMVLPLNP